MARSLGRAIIVSIMETFSYKGGNKMKIKYFGTAAAEGVPALFCKCKVCQKARELGGKEIRTRSQSLVDDTLLIDFPGDSYFHFIQHNYNLADIEQLIITHGHADHFYPEDLLMRMGGYSVGIETTLSVYGNERVHNFYQRAVELEGWEDKKRLSFNEVAPFRLFQAGEYDVVPLVADHDPNEMCLIYQVTRANKTLLYAHDTGYILEENWGFWEKSRPYFNLVSLDCTHQKVEVPKNHMSIYDNLKVKNRMFKMGLADEQTKFVLSHFSHNGGMLHHEMVKWAEENNFIIAYDGFEITV